MVVSFGGFGGRAGWWVVLRQSADKLEAPVHVVGFYYYAAAEAGLVEGGME